MTVAPGIADRIKVIDTDTHVTEPADLWTSRVSKKWGDLVPHVRWDDKENEQAWFIGDDRVAAAAGSAMAGWKDYLPSHPPTFEEADPASFEPNERLKRMDEYGLYAQILYPNVGGFGGGRFLNLKEPELMLECVRAYNDFLIDWCSADPKRLIPLMAMPFWDVNACVAEMKRAWKLGHKGIIFTGEPHHFGYPWLADKYWEPLWSQAEDLGLPINFHVGSGDLTKLAAGNPNLPYRAAFASIGMSFYLDNSRSMLEVLVSGICIRHPKLKFVSVESGIGWIPFALHSMDWQWTNMGCIEENPEFGGKLPSELFKEHYYGCFWFEDKSAKATVDILGADNFLYETDFPHPTSMAPGPATAALNPREFMDRTFADWKEEDVRKVLHDNAAKLYHLDV